MPSDLSMNDNQNTKPKKGILQSLQSLTFSHDDNLDDQDDIPTPVSEESAMSVGPVPGPAPMPTPEPVSMVEEVAPITNLSNESEESSVVPVEESADEAEEVDSVEDTKPVDLGDDVTLETIEKSLNQEMRKSIESVKESAKKVKAKANFDLITFFGTGAKEVVVFNTFLTKEMPYTSKSGKTGTQRVNFFGVMTESGVYAIRASSAITAKLEDALKHTVGMHDNSVGLLGDGGSRRFVLKLPAEEYGNNNTLHVGLVGNSEGQNPNTFTGLDAIEVDTSFINDLMELALSEVDAMLDYENRRKANLKTLQDKKDAEIKKASAISDKLGSLAI